MLEGGVKIFEYQPTMIHTKCMVVDGLFSMFGSSNLDARSSEINEELDVVVYDAEFGRQMETMFEKDLVHAREYTLQQFQQRSLWERTTEWLMLPFRSQLWRQVGMAGRDRAPETNRQTDSHVFSAPSSNDAFGNTPNVGLPFVISNAIHRRTAPSPGRIPAFTVTSKC